VRCRHEDRTENLKKAAVAQQCRLLRLPAVADQCASLAEVAIKQRQTYLAYLEALLAAELEERERNTVIRRIRDARLPRMKSLEEFDFSRAPQVAPTRIHELAGGGYIERAEPVILIGDCGTGKTPSADRAVCRGLPPEAARALRHGCRAGQRAGRSQTATSVAPSAGPMGAL
jgi:hypothetical protein